MRIELTPAFHKAFPEGVFGALIAGGCANRPRTTAIDADRRMVETRLRERFPENAIDGASLASAYAGYFRRFGSRYPVVHQAKTILAGHPIASDSALVEVMFTAELDSLVLTSRHDLPSLKDPLSVDVAGARDTYTKLSGKEQTLRAGDMIVRDDTTAALFGAWCPQGIAPSTVEAHLLTLAALLRREWPEATVEAPQIVHAAPAG